MDNVWERSIPLYNIYFTEMNRIFYDFDSRITVLSYKEVNIGCRNSNFIVETDSGTYFLRVTPPNDNGYINEKAAFDLLKDVVNMPSYYYTSTLNERICLIYKFIDAVSLQSKCCEGMCFENDIIRQIAETAALIHNIKECDTNEFTKLELPPYDTWYDMFLSNSNAIFRLGYEIVERVKNLIRENKTNLSIIDSYQSLIHSDFRPANMLIDKNNQIYITDWEGAGKGHTLADIGQFFRYGKCFKEEQKLLFEVVYNKYARVQLPKNWYDLSKLRDLINPLQMLGANEELPSKYNDLKNIIIDTLEYFDF